MRIKDKYGSDYYHASFVDSYDKESKIIYETFLRDLKDLILCYVCVLKISYLRLLAKYIKTILKCKFRAL